MRVLWFSPVPLLNGHVGTSYNGGGWIASLEQILKKKSNVKLGLAFKVNFHVNDFKFEQDDICSYPIPNDKVSLSTVLRRKANTNLCLEYCKRIISDFKPDLIQIFGSENEFGLLCECTDIPIVIHMQGFLPAHYNALFPVGMSEYDFLFLGGLSLHQRYMGIRSPYAFKRDARREIGIIRSCNYFIGRTEWDKNIISLINPSAKYFHCEEALRDTFIQNKNIWKFSDVQKFKIISVISFPWYKGTDLILKTAKLLTEFSDMDFEWDIYGVEDIEFYERKYRIMASDVNVAAKGIVTKEELAEILRSGQLYVHPSYIDNSPNSVCEAQIMGIPVIATNVGGLSSLIKDGESGFLVPANDPYYLAYLILKLHNDKNTLERISNNEIILAKHRHNPDKIGNTIIKIYSEILK